MLCEMFFLCKILIFSDNGIFEILVIFYEVWVIFYLKFFEE